MTLRLRKLTIVLMIIAVFVFAKIMVIANWLVEMGIPVVAEKLKEDFLTGTAVTIIIVLMILMVNPYQTTAGKKSFCPVCREKISVQDSYCRSCGSKI